MSQRKNRTTSKPSAAVKTSQAFGRPAPKVLEKKTWAYENVNGKNTTLGQLGESLDALSDNAAGLAYLLEKIYFEGAYDLAPPLQSALKLAINHLKSENEKLLDIWPIAMGVDLHVVSEMEVNG